MSTVRAASLQRYPELMTALGCDVQEALMRCGLTLTDLALGDQYISYQSVLAAIQYPADHCGIVDFGLRFAREQGTDFLGPMRLMARHAATPYEALTDIAAYASFHSSAIRLEVTDGTERDSVSMHLSAEALENYPQGAEHAASILLLLFLQSSEPADYSAIKVTLPHAPLSKNDVYLEHFCVLPTFGAQAVSVTLPHSLSRAPNPEANTHMHDLTRRILMDFAATPVTRTIRTLKTLLIQSLPTDQLDLHAAARALGIHPRTLQRRLQSEGTSFEKLRDEARKALFEKLILKSASLADLAQTLGFSDQSVLSRACKTWFGMTPRRFRDKALQLQRIGPGQHCPLPIK